MEEMYIRFFECSLQFKGWVKRSVSRNNMNDNAGFS